MNARRVLLGALGLGGVALTLLLAVLERDASWAVPARDSDTSAGAVASFNEPLAPEETTSAGTETSAPPREALPLTAPDAFARLPFARDDLYGTVIDRKTRAPIAGASVLVFEPDTPYDDLASGLRAVLTTDSEGRFRCAGVGALRALQLRVQAEGYRLFGDTFLTGRAHIFLLDRALTISGLVLQAQDRRPVAGAWVSLTEGERWNGNAFVPDRVLTDAEGRFSLGNVPASEKIALRVRPEGWWRFLHRLSTTDESIENLEILLPTCLALRLRMIDLANGLPLARLRGQINAVGDFETDGEGVITLQLPPEELRGTTLPVVVESSETCTTRIQVPLERAAEVIDVPLSRGATIEGRVIDRNGLPIPKASVILRVSPAFADPSEPAHAGLPPGVTIQPADRRWVTTDEQGGFELDRLLVSTPPGQERRTELRVTREGWLSCSHPVALPPPGASTRVEVLLERGAAVRGRVLLDGEPLAGARVWTFLQALQEHKHCQANDRGEYALSGLSSGSVRLSVKAVPDPEIFVDWTPLGEEWVTLFDGETLEHDLHVHDDHASIEGVVRDKDGRSLAGAAVFVRGEGATFNSTGMIRGHGEPSTLSSADGRFYLPIADGTSPLEIVAWRDGQETSSSALPGTRDLVLVLSPSSTLLLTVMDETGGSIPFLGNVPWWSAGTPHGMPAAGLITRPTPRADGRFALVLPVGCWEIEVLAAGYAPTPLAACLHADGPTEATLTLRRGVTLELVLEGEGPPGAELSLSPADEVARGLAGDMALMVSGRSRTIPGRPAEGMVVVPNLAPGVYVLGNPEYGWPGWSLDPQRFDVPDVERHRVTVRWVRMEGEH